MEVFNLHGDEWNRTEKRPGWRSKDAWIGARLNAELIGASLYELEPGTKLFPSHTHHANRCQTQEVAPNEGALIDCC
jgi:uncharacterized cupin superfamily protein